MNIHEHSPSTVVNIHEHSWCREHSWIFTVLWTFILITSPVSFTRTRKCIIFAWCVVCGLLLFFRRVGCIVAAIHGALLSAEASKRGYNMQSISPVSVLVNGAWLCREVILLETVVDTLEATVLVSAIDTNIVSSLGDTKSLHDVHSRFTETPPFSHSRHSSEYYYIPLYSALTYG